MRLLFKILSAAVNLCVETAHGSYNAGLCPHPSILSPPSPSPLISTHRSSGEGREGGGWWGRGDTYNILLQCWARAILFNVQGYKGWLADKIVMYTVLCVHHNLHKPATPIQLRELGNTAARCHSKNWARNEGTGKQDCFRPVPTPGAGNSKL